MIRVLNIKNECQTVCENCLSTLGFTAKDLRKEKNVMYCKPNGLLTCGDLYYVKCPVCRNRTYVDGKVVNKKVFIPKQPDSKKEVTQVVM